MEVKELSKENISIKDPNDSLNLKIEKDNINYLLKIFPSKDNISLIFKLEKDKIQTSYYYAKYDLDDFKKISKKFQQENNIKNIYSKMKEIISNNTCKIEKKGLTYEIKFYKQNKEKIFFFTLKKKIVAQERLNEILFYQIQEDKAKIKLAEQAYNTSMNRIEKEDKMFDLQLNKLESEHSALQTEYESVAKVISKNVEKSFGTFNA